MAKTDHSGQRKGKNRNVNIFLTIRDRSFITSQGGRWFWRGGGYNFKTSPFLGGKFFSGKKHEGGSNFMTQQQQSREFDVSGLSSIPWWGKGKNLTDFRSRGKGCLTWSRKSLGPSSQSAILKITRLSLRSIFSRSFNWYI